MTYDIDDLNDHEPIANYASFCDDLILADFLTITIDELKQKYKEYPELEKMIRSSRAYAKIKVAEKCYTKARDNGCSRSIQLILNTQAKWNNDEDFDFDENAKITVEFKDFSEPSKTKKKVTKKKIDK